MKFYLLFFVFCFFSFLLFAEEVYQGKIIGEDKSELNNVKIKEEIKREEVEEKEFEIKVEPNEKIPIEKIVTTKPEKKEEVKIKEEGEVELQKKEIEMSEEMKSTIEKNIEKKPQKPYKFKIILLSILGFFILLAIGS